VLLYHVSGLACFERVTGALSAALVSTSKTRSATLNLVAHATSVASPASSATSLATFAAPVVGLLALIALDEVCERHGLGIGLAVNFHCVLID